MLFAIGSLATAPRLSSPCDSTRLSSAVRVTAERRPEPPPLHLLPGDVVGHRRRRPRSRRRTSSAPALLETHVVMSSSSAPACSKPGFTLAAATALDQICYRTATISSPLPPDNGCLVLVLIRPPAPNVSSSFSSRAFLGSTVTRTRAVALQAPNCSSSRTSWPSPL
ncbi:hypothetical protein U9M48_011263 [Paspalum notatum var. saurae]|uniref:Uncharacterized protein n=1 Tax=Paspalum notatum var. saurae TaxID=547442 RepID=A0AAQ3SWX1_PASNO